jgi:UDP-N-acetylmuramate dehydrogenase
MTIDENVSLKTYNTFGLDYKADRIIHADSIPETYELFRKQDTLQKPLLVLGGGSNLLFTKDFKGTIIYPRFNGINAESASGDDVLVSAGAGVNWDELVGWTVSKGLSGLENLSFIPGNVGASPVQNIGAYGVEVRELIEKVETIDIRNGSKRYFSNTECEFGYRNSIFKRKEKGNYLVTRVWFRLKTVADLKLNYGSLADELSKMGSYSPANVRQAVIKVRKSKLPDPAIIGNAGSFFKNPVITESDAEKLKSKYEKIPFYIEKPGFVKLAAGWLIEQCGWKGKKDGNAGVHEKQALVIVNYGHASGLEIYNLSEKIKRSVFEKFGTDLEREVEVIGII